MKQLELIHVGKQIGKATILSDINLTLSAGNVYGFVGRNGSGKTMLFRAIIGLMRINEGKIIADGKELHRDISVLPGVGVTLENVGLYPEFTGIQNLKMLADINRKIGMEDIRNAIKRVGLNPDDKRTVRKYSLGMKQRIVLAQALMEQPEVLLLDEPTNALDDGGIDMIRDIILEEKKRGAIVLVASHNKEDIDLLCDEVYRIKEGKIVERKVVERKVVERKEAESEHREKILVEKN